MFSDCDAAGGLGQGGLYIIRGAARGRHDGQTVARSRKCRLPTLRGGLQGGYVVWANVCALVVMAVAPVAKNLYMRLYIYAKPEAKMYKYTAVTPTFRGVISGKTCQTRTVFGALGAVSGHGEGRQSNNLLQNGSIWHLFRFCFRLFRGRFSEPQRWSFFCSRWSLRS
mgnify:CR=1 FL=1